MKKLTFVLASAMFFFESFSQQIDPAPALTKQDYLEKSKKQKTNAWVLLGLGTAMLIGGGYVAGQETFDNDGEDEGVVAGGVVAAIGVASMVGSIPLFIASSRNKRKAASISFNYQRVRQFYISGLVSTSLPSLTLKFHL